MIISYITTIREKKQIETCKVFENGKAREPLKTPALVYKSFYGICARSFGRNVNFTRAEPFSFG